MPTATERPLETLTACPLCGAAEIAKAPAQPKPPFGLMHCLKCAGIFLNPRPRIEDMHNYYDDFYKGEREKSTRQERRAKKHFRRLARVSPTPGALLEVGAGDGYFLNAAKEAGWRVHGLELSHPRIEQARRWFDIDLLPQDLLKADLRPNSFDAVVMFQLIEHVHDPRAILKRVHEVLRPGGILMLSTPNVLAYGRKKRDVDHWLIPRHLFFFTPASLVTNAESLGLHCLRRSLRLQAKLEHKLNWRPWTRSRTLTGTLRNLCTPFALRLVARKQ